MICLLMLCFFGNPFKLKAPIPVEDWQVVADPAKGIADAVVLEDHTLIKAEKILRYRRIRILSEAGKLAAVVIDPGGRLKGYKARMVDAKGVESRLSGTDTLIEQKEALSANAEEHSHAYLPPGLTENCIVELAWELPFNFTGRPGGEKLFGLDPFMSHLNITAPPNKNPILYEDRVDEPYVVLRKSYENTLSHLRPHREILSNPTLRFRWEDRTKVFENLPATVASPFGMPNQADHVCVFRIDKHVGEYTVFNAYWGWAAVEYKKSIEYTPLLGKYKSWSKEAIQNLPADPRAAMTLLLSRFRDHFEVKKMPQPKQIENAYDNLNWFKSSPLKKIAGQGFGDAHQLNQLFLNLLRQTSIPYRIVLAADQEDPRFDRETRYIGDLRHVLVGLVTEGDLVFVDPSQDGYPIGQLPASVSGAAALVIDPKPSGSFSWTQIPTQGPERNQITTAYAAKLVAEGGVTCQVTRTARGLYASECYRACAALDQANRDAQIGQRWGKAPVSVQQARLEGLDAFQGQIQEHLCLTWTGVINESSCQFQPFPGTLAMEMPDVWPEHRNQDLYLPFAGKHNERCDLEVPEGWQLVGDNAWAVKNEIGEISFEAVQKDSRIETQCETIVYKDVYPRTLEPALKQFLAWQASAKGRTLELKK